MFSSDESDKSGDIESINGVGNVERSYVVFVNAPLLDQIVSLRQIGYTEKKHTL